MVRLSTMRHSLTGGASYRLLDFYALKRGETTFCSWPGWRWNKGHKPDNGRLYYCEELWETSKWWVQFSPLVRGTRSYSFPKPVIILQPFPATIYFWAKWIMIYIYAVRYLLSWQSNYDFTTKNDKKIHLGEQLPMSQNFQKVPHDGPLVTLSFCRNLMLSTSINT